MDRILVNLTMPDLVRHALSAPNYRLVMRWRWQEWNLVSETMAFAVAA
jgi:hypothetical protein